MDHDFLTAADSGFYRTFEEAADELIDREPHDLLPRVAIDAVILVLERDAAAVAGDVEEAVLNKPNL